MKERLPVAYRFQEAICSKARPRAVRIPAAGTLSGFKEVGEPVRFETTAEDPDAAVNCARS